MAMENPKIKADVIEAQEFPYLARTYRVQAVPKTVINGVVEFVGAVSEQLFLQKVLSAVGREDLLEVAKVSGSEEPVGGPSTLLDRPT